MKLIWKQKNQQGYKFIINFSLKFPSINKTTALPQFGCRYLKIVLFSGRVTLVLWRVAQRRKVGLGVWCCRLHERSETQSKLKGGESWFSRISEMFCPRLGVNEFLSQRLPQTFLVLGYLFTLVVTASSPSCSNINTLFWTSLNLWTHNETLKQQVPVVSVF